MRVIILGITLLCVGCSAGEIANKAEHTEAINQLYQTFEVAYDSLDPGIVGDLYAEDAHYLLPNSQAPVLEGQAKIKESFSGFLTQAKENNRNVNISFRIIHRQIGDSLAYDIGYYRTRSKPDSVEDFPERGSVGKFVTVMGLQPNGEWKFLVDGYSSAPTDAFLSADSSGFNPAK